VEKSLALSQVSNDEKGGSLEQRGLAPSGIAGWLILPAFFTFASVPYMTLGTYAFVMAYLHLGMEITFEDMTIPLVGVGWIISCFLLVQKRRSYPRLFVALSSVLFLYGLFVAYLFLNTEHPVRFPLLEGPYLLNGLLIPYMLLSKRVKNTFVN
jgi:hypothetical protein